MLERTEEGITYLDIDAARSIGSELMRGESAGVYALARELREPLSQVEVNGLAADVHAWQNDNDIRLDFKLTLGMAALSLAKDIITAESAAKALKEHGVLGKISAKILANRIKRTKRDIANSSE